MVNKFTRMNGEAEKAGMTKIANSQRDIGDRRWGSNPFAERTSC
jgi:hypothetical protein